MRLTDLLKDKNIEIFVYIHEIISYFHFFTMQNLEKKKNQQQEKEQHTNSVLRELKKKRKIALLQAKIFKSAILKV